MSAADLLRHRPFRNLWIGQSISQFGDSLVYVVTAFMVGKLTGKASLVALNGILETAPFLLLGPYAGSLADRLDRRTMMIVSDLLCALVMLCLAGAYWLLKSPPVEAIMVATCLQAICRSFFSPAKDASIPNVAPPGKVLEANGFSQATFNLVVMTGLALSAGLLALFYPLGPTKAFSYTILVDSLTFLGSALFIMALPSLKPNREEEPKHPVLEMKEGLSFVMTRPDLKKLLLFILLQNLIFSPFFPVYVKANELWFGNLPQILTWFEFSFFLGVVMGSWWVARVKFRALGWGTVWSHLLIAIAIGGMAVARGLWGFIFCNWAAGIVLPAFWLLRETYMQVTVPDHVRGRVQSLRGMAVMGVQPLGLAFGGLMIDAWGLPTCFLAMGGACLLIAAMAYGDQGFRDLQLPETA